MGMRQKRITVIIFYTLINLQKLEEEPYTVKIKENVKEEPEKKKNITNSKKNKNKKKKKEIK